MITEEILRAVAKFSLFEKGTFVTVACSGGADSMALLWALCALKETCGIGVGAAHFNHGIRGREADADEEFVRRFCEKNGILFWHEKADVPRYAAENGMGTEEAARQLRYDFLERVAPPGVIATAHTADDNLETLLFHLARGTGLSGLCGIPPKRGRFVRPMIFCSREEVETYCRENGIPFVTDKTNFSDRYARNRLRLHAVPVLKSVNPAVAKSVNRTVAALCEDRDCLDSLAKAEYDRRKRDGRLAVSDFGELHPAIAKRVLKCFLSENGLPDPDHVHLQALFEISVSGGRTGLPGNRTAAVQKGELSVFSTDRAPVYEVKWEETDVFPKENRKIHNLLFKSLLDCDKIVGKLVLRNRLPGDRVCIRSGSGTKTLKKLFNENRIPLNERENLPILCDDAGIVWIYRIGAAARCAIGESTTRAIKISVKSGFLGEDKNGFAK